MSERICSNCKHCFHEDFGYSNYTVEGTTMSCLLDLNDVVDEYHSDDKVQQWADKAQTCEHFVEGTGFFMDCDNEEATESNIEEWLALNPDLHPAAAAELRSKIV